MSAGEIRRIERWLASARVFLAVAGLVAVQLDPGSVHVSIWLLGLLAFYIAQGVVVIIFLRRRQESTASFRFLLHTADIIWPALISMFSVGNGNPFFLFFVFVLAAAAYRWGLWETVGTAAGAVVLLWIESFCFRWGVIAGISRFFHAQDLPALPLDAAYFGPKNLFMRSISLMVLGFLLGYLAEQQKRLRAERMVIARTLGKARVEAGVSKTLQEIAQELLSMYGAKSLLIASQDATERRIFVGLMQQVSDQVPTLRWIDPGEDDKQVFLEDTSATTFYARRNGQGVDSPLTVLALDSKGGKIPNPSSAFLDRLAKRYEFHNVMLVSFSFGQEWQGRIFLLDPALTGEMEEELQFLQEFVSQVGPAVYNVLLLRRLRLRAGAVERARFARELHDGAVQSLIAVEMQVDVLRRQAASKPEVVVEELSRIQGLLREEVLKLRELMQQLKTLDVDGRRLPRLMRDTVERFQRETGIAARFISDFDELDLPQPVCRELARIVQEALVNVRKHSQASSVMVQFGWNRGMLKVGIEDNGRGFPFSGKFSQEQLDTLGKGPLVIRERVRLIEGQLTIESTPGQGSRLEITLPQWQGVVHG
jgi:signal transduction histidine kinase